FEAVRGASTDWIDQVLRSAPIASLEGSVRGGNERVKYYVSGSSVLQDGTVKSMGYDRMNGRINLDYVPVDRLSLGTNVALARTVYHRARNDNTIYGAFANALANPPITPVYTEDGDYYETLYANPVGMNNEAEAEERGTRILGNVFSVLQLSSGINARASIGLDNLTLRSRTYDSPRFGPWSSNGGAAEAANNFVNKITYEGTLNFGRVFGSPAVADQSGDSHEISGVLGASYEDNTREGQNVQGTQFPTEFFKYITSAATISSGTSSRSDWGLTSYFGRLSYTYNDKITATVNVRRDGSSRFGADNRFGTFPSVSLLWRVGDESFLQSQNILRNLAVRASYGVTGNQQTLGDFASRGLFTGGANYDDQPGISPSQLANPNLRWEKTNQMNAGTDFSVLNDRLAITFDYYTKKTEDLLVQRPVPRTTGFASIWDNVGSMENKGLEVGLRADLVRGGAQGLNWASSLSYSRNRNKVLELYHHQPIA
ncbi:MAG: TonB-dependent receptor domain-containing protein, partial [Longimicrobiales bacterium]